jgi:hypothetical protein
MSFEIIKPFYVVDRDLIKPKINLRRITANTKSIFEKNERFYFAYNRRNILFYLSVTSFCKHVLPTSPHLLKWYVEQGEEAIEENLHLSSTYGTIMHDVLLTYLRDGKISMSEVFHMLEFEMRQNNIHPSYYSKWKDDLISDILAFAAWVQEFNIRPVVIEYPLASNKMKLGGVVDLVATATIPIKGYHGEVYVQGPQKGQPKETILRMDKTILVDLKSGRKAFYDAHKLQLLVYKRMWHETFGKILPVDSVYNWSPTDWRVKPNSSFTCQDGAYSEESIQNFIDRIKIDNLAEPGMTFKAIIGDELTIDKMPDYIVLNLEDTIRAKDAIIY